MHTILIIEDNEELGAALASNLEVEGYRTLRARDGARGLDIARESRPDLVILDLSLPTLDGLQVLGALRRDGLQLPVLILTARCDEVDKVLGFRLGADDYVTKPFGLLELIARVSALLRRAAPARDGVPAEVRPPAASPRAQFGDVVVDLAARTVEREGSDVAIPPKAFELLAALIDARGAAVSRLDLLRDVWGYSDEVTSRTVDSHVAELRRRLESDPANPQHILTVRKTGYRLRLACALLATFGILGAAAPMDAQSAGSAAPTFAIASEAAALDSAAIVAAARPDIDAANAAWVPGLRRHDAAAIVAAYADSGLFIGPDGSVTRGREAIGRMYASRFPKLRAIVDGGVIQRGLAVVSATRIYEWGDAWLEIAGPTANAAPVRHTGAYITIWDRGADGHWHITRNLAL